MAVDRPTFSENWYRVESLKPKLRTSVQSFRQQFRGQTWHVLRDPSNNQFFRLNDASYFFVGLLDGKRTVADAWRIANDRLGDRAPTQGEVIQLFGQLYTSNLLHSDLPADTAGMFERHRKRVNREVRGYVMNFMFMRFPLFNPQRILDQWIGAVSWVFGPIGFVLWLALMGVAFWHLTGNWGELVAGAQPQELLKPDNILIMYGCFAVIKAIHEFGHGFACKRFGVLDGSGGDVHTMGIMLLVMMPVPYVDASSSWAFRSKWRRAFVGAAGMYVELAVAAVAAIIWARTTSGSPAHAIAYNIIFIASVSTLLFNSNPLLRYDGYYILSDLLEIPNLSQRSKEYLYYLVKRYAYGVKRARQIAHLFGEKIWLFIYSIASSIYRVVILTAILMFIADAVPVVGAILALAAIIVWFLVPIGKFFKFLLTSQELERTRTRSIWITGSLIGLLIAGIGFIPAPDRSRAEGVVVPKNFVVVHMGENGFIKKTLSTGTDVSAAGSMVITAINDELQADYKSMLARQKELRVYYRQSKLQDEANSKVYEEMLQALEMRIALREKRIEALTIKPVIDGLWISPEIDQLTDAYIPRGQEIGMIADLSELVIRVVADQYLGPRLEPELGKEGSAVEIKLKGRPEAELAGTIQRIYPGGHEQLPSPSLSYLAGGSLALDTEDPQSGKAAEPFFEVRISVDSPNDPASKQPPLLVGQRVMVRFELPSKPLAVQWWRSLSQMVQKRFKVQM